MRILEEIEIVSCKNESIVSKNKLFLEESIYWYERSKIFNKDQKIITSKEMEKFFIFICGLSTYQLKVLNDTQPEPSQKRNDLPIIFNNQFQDCLTNSQRMNLSLLETMSLSRYILLKDSNKDISLENLDYRFMQYRIKDKDSDEEDYYKRKRRNYSRYVKTRNSKGLKLKSCNTLNRNNGLSLKKKYEFEEQYSALNYVMNNNNEKNKRFISLHKSCIFKLMDTMNKDEKKIFQDNPELLTKLIKNTQKYMKTKED